MWMWQEAGVGLVVAAIGMELAFARVLSGPAWLWGPRDPVTGEPVPATRLTGRALLATGVGLQRMSWLGTPAGLWAGTVGVVFLLMAVVLHAWAAQLSRSIL